MSALVVFVMMFALVSIGEAGWLPNPPNLGNFLTGESPYPCIASPAYTHYTGAKNGPCPAPERRRVTPEPMGSPGL
jgi:hypothetical protein